MSSSKIGDWFSLRQRKVLERSAFGHGTDMLQMHGTLDAVADGKKSRKPKFQSAPPPQNTDDDFSTDFERGQAIAASGYLAE
jgi:hypothetical protein